MKLKLLLLKTKFCLQLQPNPTFGERPVLKDLAPDKSSKVRIEKNMGGGVHHNACKKKSSKVTTFMKNCELMAKTMNDNLTFTMKPS